MTIMSKLFRNFINSRVGQLFFVIHLILFIICAVNLRGLYPDEFQSHYLSKIFFVIVLFDYPVLAVLRSLTNYLLITPTNFSDSIIGLIASVQWWVIGYFLEFLIKGVQKIVSKFSLI